VLVIGRYLCDEKHGTAHKYSALREIYILHIKFFAEGGLTLNKLNEMDIAKLSDQEVSKLTSFEQELNRMHGNEEIYVLVLKR
jgi:hypothetical protein